MLEDIIPRLLPENVTLEGQFVLILVLAFNVVLKVTLPLESLAESRVLSADVTDLTYSERPVLH